ncbi:RDD family protein [Actinomadura sp. KC345]|uniref:RDD family protein n=1 Tax=Actinomadura sp. KC345 TaxID=2530371 RepID=UPI00105086A1|nr:RDD family protein [Actinomadura sp. KC345]TDC39329.1 RDD family protein [Actinomadura sp. KC345]
MSAQPNFVEPGAPPPADGGPFLVLASARQRVAARLIDLVTAVMALMTPQFVLMGLVIGVDGDRFSDLVAPMTLVAMLTMVWIWMFLRVVRLVLWGCTVGQRIAGIRVVGLDDLRYPGWKRAFKRWMPTWGGRGTPAMSPWGDVASYRKDPRTRSCLHDLAAGTVVIQAGKDEPVHRAALALLLPAVALALVLGFHAVA